jgi:multicomponent Na+:H+ antiporter subunit B
LQYLLFPLLILLAVVSLSVRDLLGAVFLLGGYSFLAALVLALMAAPDVSFTEAAVGAGITGVFFVLAITRTTRRSQD